MSVIRAIARSVFNARRISTERVRPIPALVPVRARVHTAPLMSARRGVMHDSYLYGYLPS
jgi:hypothetical protein